MVKRSRGKILTLLATVLVVGVATAWLLIRNGQARTEFISTVDPASGYRCRFTISSHWKRRERQRLQALRLNTRTGGQFETFVYTPSPIHAWIESHLLHSPPSVTMIDFLSGSFQGAGQVVQRVGGYPEPALPNVGTRVQVRTFVHRHLKVNGCPATLLTVGFGSVRLTELFVMLPDQSRFYSVGGVREVSQSDTERELQQVIASFHIEKAGPGPDGK